MNGGSLQVPELGHVRVCAVSVTVTQRTASLPQPREPVSRDFRLSPDLFNYPRQRKDGGPLFGGDLLSSRMCGIRLLTFL